MAKGSVRSIASAKSAPPRLEVVHIPVGDLRPNPWNPNRVAPDVMHKLREYIRVEGLVQPIVVRRLSDHYQILGGFHRWTICKNELGYAEVPCVVVDVDDKRAKLLTVNLNELSGDPVPRLMAELIHDLSRDTSLEDLSTILPYSEAELADLDALMKVPDGLDAFIEAEVQRQGREAPVVLTFVVADAALVERAVEFAASKIEGKNARGRSLQAICAAFLESHGVEAHPADEQPSDSEMG